MSRLDEDREDLIRLIYSICDYARLGSRISTYNNCNDCKDKDCQYRPDWMDPVRLNCPLWLGSNQKRDSVDDAINAQKKGEWIDVDDQTYTWKIVCSQCGHERSMMSTQGNYPNFCENCGAYMRGENK